MCGVVRLPQLGVFLQVRQEAHKQLPGEVASSLEGPHVHHNIVLPRRPLLLQRHLVGRDVDVGVAVAAGSKPTLGRG